MKISFTKKLAVIGSIFCGLISPSKADLSYISPSEKYFVAWSYGFSKCSIKKRNISMSSEELIKSVKSTMNENNDGNPDLLKDDLVIQVGERIAKRMGNDCNKKENLGFREEQYELFRQDLNSVEKYEKVLGKKFTPDQERFSRGLKFRCASDGNLGEDLDKCVITGVELAFSGKYEDLLLDEKYKSSFTTPYMRCYRRNYDVSTNIQNYYGYENLDECITNQSASIKNCKSLESASIYRSKFEKYMNCQADYRDKYLRNKQNNILNAKTNFINKNEDLVLFEKKFCWSDGECWETYYDKNSFQVTTDGVTFFEKRILHLANKNTTSYYSNKTLNGIDCATKEFVQKRGRKNILFPKDATREQKKVFDVKRFKKEYDLACNGGKYPAINKTSQEMFITQKDNIFSEETNQKLFESTKEGMKKIDKNSKKQKQKSEKDAHQICLKAADYKGCMNYQNR